MPPLKGMALCTRLTPVVVFAMVGLALSLSQGWSGTSTG